MAAFDRIKSGLPGVDKTVDSIRMGDNVVWQVSSIDDYRFFVTPFVNQAIRDGRNLIYIRFAQHAPLCEKQPGLKIYELAPSDGFEAFTVGVNSIITSEGRDAFYVFDSLSELQEVWSTDLMMGNFFRVTCPYLFQLDTVAYFPLLRGMHSFDAVSRIRETTQLMLDVFSCGDTMYLTPLKVWNRYSGDMFSPHKYSSGDDSFSPLTDGISISRYYASLDAMGTSGEQSLDSWDRYFSMMKLRFGQGCLPDSECRKMCDIMMTKDARVSDMIAKYFTPRDYFLIRDRMIGTGMIGGKACGMLLARRIIQSDMPEAFPVMEPHDSYYIGSDVFYTYIVHNGWWKTRIEQRAERDSFEISAEFGEKLRSGRFPEDIREQFRRMLDYFGQSPIVVRSSSFLEDGFGNAFAGKYESVFCVGTGDIEQRLQTFENAVRTVYASTMDPSALEYRKVRGLLESDEQMAILVQRVSGSRFGNLFMPTAAGVGYSHNAYRWSPSIDPEAGMLRIVMGLGTRAVDRTEGDYPRIISLDQPLVSTLTTFSERHKFSQHYVDVLDSEKDSICSKKLEDVIPLLPRWTRDLVLSHDSDAERAGRARGDYMCSVLFADCQAVVENSRFVSVMHGILSTLQRAYGAPVDIEFTLNGGESGDFVVNLLQCRPLHVGTSARVDMDSIPDGEVLFDISGSSMGRSRAEKIGGVVYVDPRKYYDLPYAQKPRIARDIGLINRIFRSSGKKLMLIVPGRIGTSSPELGVPVVYAEISSFSAVCEAAYSAAGYMPELSYGSHMFQDLVEADIYYGALFENEKTRVFSPQSLLSCPDITSEMIHDTAESSGLLRVLDTDARDLRLYFDMVTQRAVCIFLK